MGRHLLDDLEGAQRAQLYPAVHQPGLQAAVGQLLDYGIGSLPLHHCMLDHWPADAAAMHSPLEHWLAHQQQKHLLFARHHWPGDFAEIHRPLAHESGDQIQCLLDARQRAQIGVRQPSEHGLEAHAEAAQQYRAPVEAVHALGQQRGAPAEVVQLLGRQHGALAKLVQPFECQLGALSVVV